MIEDTPLPPTSPCYLYHQANRESTHLLPRYAPGLGTQDAILEEESKEGGTDTGEASFRYPSIQPWLPWRPAFDQPEGETLGPPGQ